MNETIVTTRSSIYWVGSRCGRFIKQGWSEKPTPNGRIKNHRTAKNQSIKWGEVLVYVSGSYDDESFLKLYFKDFVVDHKEHGDEIFHAEPLLPYITWLRMQWFSRHDNDATEIPDYEPASNWFPNGSRVSTARREWDLEATLKSQENFWWFLLDDVVDSTEQYITPTEILDAVRTAFGGVIDFDPASDSSANRHVRATQYLTETLDGLSQPWRGAKGLPVTAWLSVPYKQMEKWLRKISVEMQSGRVHEAILLAETRMLAANYFQPFLGDATLCIINGYYQFGGKGANMPTTQDRQVLVYFGPNPRRFTESVKHLGHVYKEIA